MPGMVHSVWSCTWITAQELANGYWTPHPILSCRQPVLVQGLAPKLHRALAQVSLPPSACSPSMYAMAPRQMLHMASSHPHTQPAPLPCALQNLCLAAQGVPRTAAAAEYVTSLLAATSRELSALAARPDLQTAAGRGDVATGLCGLLETLRGATKAVLSRTQRPLFELIAPLLTPLLTLMHAFRAHTPVVAAVLKLAADVVEGHVSYLKVGVGWLSVVGVVVYMVDARRAGQRKHARSKGAAHLATGLHAG